MAAAEGPVRTLSSTDYDDIVDATVAKMAAGKLGAGNLKLDDVDSVTRILKKLNADPTRKLSDVIIVS